MEVFESSLFNIGAAVTSVRWHFGSTIKIQQWPCCFNNQLSMHNIPPVCATWISPGPGFSTALILKKKERPFIRPSRKSEKLFSLISGEKRKSWERKKNRQIGADIYLHYLERSSNWFLSSDCELWSREHNDHLQADTIAFIEKGDDSLCVAQRTAERSLSLKERKNTFHSRYCFYKVLRPV